MAYPFHEAADIFPMMEDDKLDELAEDIREHGLQRPIELFGGQILDGRNRYVACQRIGKMPEFITLKAIDDPVAYVLSCNLYRRQLTVAQRAMVGDKVRAYYDRQAKDAMSEGGKKAGRGRPLGSSSDSEQGKETFPTPIQSRDQAGKAVGVSGRTMDKAKKVREQGHRRLIEAVESGKLDVTKASKLAELPKEVQDTILDDAERQGWSGRKMVEEAKRLTPFEAPAKVDESKLTGDSYNLQQLKHYWQRASKSDKKSFKQWIGLAMNHLAHHAND